MTTRRDARAAVALVLTVCAWLALSGLSSAGSSPAAAATCADARGVTVVVDYHQLGGGTPTACDLHGGGHYASDLFPDNGFALTYVQRQPGFVCRVNGAPSDDPCVNTPPSDAYWGLWWSDGTSGTWTYASAGVGSLKIPEGGSVALSWNGQDGKSEPGVAPPKHAAQPSSSPTATPSSTPSHTASPTRAPTTAAPTQPTTAPPATSLSPSATSSAASPTASASASRSARDEGRKKQHHHAHATPSSSPSSSPSAAPPDDVTTADPPAASSGGLPGWVAPVLVGVLLAAAGAVSVVRRRRAGP